MTRFPPPPKNLTPPKRQPVEPSPEPTFGEALAQMAMGALRHGPLPFDHYRIEGNRPATFKYPLWSFAADFKMLGKIVQGEMQEEVRRADALAAREPVDITPEG